MQQKILACDVKLKRTYGPPSARDGTRILIDRLWPRGVKRAGAVIDRWIKAIVPSTPLRKWLRHNPARCRGSAAATRPRSTIRSIRLESCVLWRKGPITLVFAARDEPRDVLLG